MTTEEDRPLADEDVRAMVRVLSHVASGQADIAERRRRLMDGLCELIEAPFWIWHMVGRFEPGEAITTTFMMHGGLSDEQLRLNSLAMEQPEMVKLNEVFLTEFAREQRHITRTRAQFKRTDEATGTKVLALREEADMGPFMLSARPTLSGDLSALQPFRRFQDEEAEVDWLHEESWSEHPRDQVYNLSPRLNTVVNFLLRGLSRKEVAAELALSEHTVGDYVKDLYGRFGVHSQAQLIHRLTLGDGGDLLAP